MPGLKHRANNVIQSCLWGITLALHAAVGSFAGLMVVRLLLGVFASANAAGLSLITSMWYTSSEQIPRHTFWFTGNAFMSITGALVAYGILQYEGHFSKWKV
jgi:MFS family permease